MHVFPRLTTPALATLAALAAAACGGSSGNGASAPNTPAMAASPAPSALGAGTTLFAQSIVIGRTSREPVDFAEVRGAATPAVLVAPTASPLLVAGSNALLATYRNPVVPGAIVACISAPTNSTGIVEGVNLGVNVKSVAALLDDTWTAAGDPAAAWAALAAGGAVFAGWENCGAKPEGQPSPSSLRTLAADGGFREQVYDGNPSTNLNIIALNYTAAQAAAMRSPEGYLTTTQAGTSRRIRVQILVNARNQTLLVEQGLPETGATAADPGYLAVYFMR